MSEDLLKRILYLIGALIVFRLGTHIVIPFISQTALASLVEDNRTGILGMMNMFSGGALERLSIFTLGIMPYISSSIIMTLMQGAILIYLVSTLRPMKTFSRKNILTQFTLFLISFVTNLTLYTWFFEMNELSTGEIKEWTGALLVGCLYMTIEILPITFMLVSQHRTFLSEEKPRPNNHISATEKVKNNS